TGYEGRRAGHRGHEQGTGESDRRRQIPGGPLLPAGRHPDRAPPAASTRGGYPVAGSALPGAVRAGGRETRPVTESAGDASAGGPRVERQRERAGKSDRARDSLRGRPPNHGGGPGGVAPSPHRGAPDHSGRSSTGRRGSGGDHQLDRKGPAAQSLGEGQVGQEESGDAAASERPLVQVPAGKIRHQRGTGLVARLIADSQ